ncbi:hypothetical protein A9Q84_03745 [Halobacteriovorax marinus]|uniref:DUF5667 domain-containing protein n=1 Tax=Halobacteriovorax marinus TaxID=97084 RepID=A0A1Y5FAA3_9BACT|nr:hypothetical protein A9Q84_03745 [Halobacteriovorax marinus]
MKKPIMYGLTALCVLSSPALVQDFKAPSFINVYRTIASEIIAEAPLSELFSVEKPTESFEEFKTALLKKAKETNSKAQRIDEISKMEDSELSKVSYKELKELKKFAKGSHPEVKNLYTQVDEVKKIITENSLNIETNPLLEEISKLRISSKYEELSDDLIFKKMDLEKSAAANTITCGLKNQISSLSEQVAELLKDKEEALAKIEEKEKKKKEREEKLKKSQELYAMGMIFGQGMRRAMAMPRMNFSPNPFMIYNPLTSLSGGNFPWMNLMRRQFSGLPSFSGFPGMSSSLPTKQTINNYLGESAAHTRDVASAPSVNFIPRFSRALVEEDSISVN